MMGYSYAYEMEEWMDVGLTMLASGVPSVLLKIAAYVLTALTLYTVASRRELKHPWLAWIPVANVWLLGSISDQYRYVVKGENRSKRKILLILRILAAVLVVVMVCLGVAAAVKVVSAVMRSVPEEQFIGMVMGPAIGILGVWVPMLGVSIAYVIIRFMALYDVYKSMDPKNSVMYLVLSILFNVTEPFFLFFNRNKDEGMPPRKHTPLFREPVYEQPQEEPWNNSETDYL